MATPHPAPAPVYPAASIKRRRRTREQVDQLDEQIMEVLRADHPQSVRHVFYMMTNPRLPEPVEKTDQGYAQVQHRIAELRRRGGLPYSWISDATRRGFHVATFDGEADFLRSVSRSYRADIWRDASVYCEVWCESRSIAGVIMPDCQRLAVSLYPAGGFTSMTLAFEAAEQIRILSAGRPAVIFYIGDYDPAGVLIDVDIRTKLREHIGSEVYIDFRRIGITPEQIATFDLPTKPRKAGDRRALHVLNTVEAEAMPAHILRALLVDEIEALLPPDAVQAAQIEEKAARSYLEEIARLTDEGRS
jgi:hypothetical protein